MALLAPHAAPQKPHRPRKSGVRQNFAQKCNSNFLTQGYPSHARPVPAIHAFLAGDKGEDGRDIGERSDAVLRAVVPGHGGFSASEKL